MTGAPGDPWQSRTPRLEYALVDALAVVELDDVAFLKVVEALERDAALVAGLDLAHVVREAAQADT